MEGRRLQHLASARLAFEPPADAVARPLSGSNVPNVPFVEWLMLERFDSPKEQIAVACIAAPRWAYSPASTQLVFERLAWLTAPAVALDVSRLSPPETVGGLAIRSRNDPPEALGQLVGFADGRVVTCSAACRGQPSAGCLSVVGSLRLEGRIEALPEPTSFAKAGAWVLSEKLRMGGVAALLVLAAAVLGLRGRRRFG